MDAAKVLATNLLINESVACDIRSQKDCRGDCMWESGRCTTFSYNRDCPCIEKNGLKIMYRDYGRCIGACVAHEGWGNTTFAKPNYYPWDYGTVSCKQWDTVNPECTTEDGEARPSAPTWCWSQVMNLLFSSLLLLHLESHFCRSGATLQRINAMKQTPKRRISLDRG